jgi:hypothetical protein
MSHLVIVHWTVSRELLVHLELVLLVKLLVLIPIILRSWLVIFELWCVGLDILNGIPIAKIDLISNSIAFKEVGLHSKVVGRFHQIMVIGLFDYLHVSAGHHHIRQVAMLAQAYLTARQCDYLIISHPEDTTTTAVVVVHHCTRVTLLMTHIDLKLLELLTELHNAILLIAVFIKQHSWSHLQMSRHIATSQSH